MAVKKDKYDVLADVVTALRDFNTKVQIETLDSKDEGWYMTWNGNDKSYIPTRRTREEFNGSASLARLHAKSIKVGEGISIKRIQRRPAYVQLPDGKRQKVDMGFYYVVRTPNGEAKFSSADNDFLTVWNYALEIHDGKGSYGRFYANLQNEKLRQIAGGPAVLKDETANKYTNAIKKLESMGIRPKKTMEFIKAKTGQEM